MTEGTVSVLIHGETLVFHPQRALLWPRRRTVIVADTHFGKSSHFARHGIAVPAGSDEADRQRITQLVKSADSLRLIILGDFVHAPLPLGSLECDRLQRWVEQLAGFLEIHVVSGNHDVGTSRTSLPSIQWWDTELIDFPFRFIHDAQRARTLDADALFTLSGHIHPVKQLKKLGKSALRVPVFWQKASGLILPSFGLFTGGFAVVPAEGDHMFAVGPSGVVPLR